MKGYLRRAGLQVLTALSQILMLALFIVAFPRLADDASAWAADYFVSLAVLTPIFMFFGFELRKRSAAETPDSMNALFGKRMRGTVYALLVGAALLLPTLALGLVSTGSIYAALLVFRVGTAINDQITAHYEAEDRFGLSLLSNLTKTGLFVGVSLAFGAVVGPEIGIIAGTAAFAIVWLLEGRNHLSALAIWRTDETSRIDRNDLMTGIGSFMVALTISLPRLVAAAFLGEQVLNMIGIGQSLNRIGQVLSGSFTQTMIALRKKLVSARGRETGATLAAQVATFFVMACLIPLWRVLFSYADGDAFVWVVGAILFFGLLSQVNFVLQSIRLIQGGGRAYLKSPMTFLAIFSTLTALIWALGQLNEATLIASMLLSRIAQLFMNWRATSQPKTEF